MSFNKIVVLITSEKLDLARLLFAVKLQSAAVTTLDSACDVERIVFRYCWILCGLGPDFRRCRRVFHRAGSAPVRIGGPYRAPAPPTVLHASQRGTGVSEPRSQ